MSDLDKRLGELEKENAALREEVFELREFISSQRSAMRRAMKLIGEWIEGDDV